MIVPRLRSEARGGSSSGSSNRYSSGGGGGGGSGSGSAVYGGKINHSHHANDPDLKRALQYSYTLQAVRRWEKRWVVIHETSMRVHKWMPAPITAPTLASQIVADKTAALSDNNNTNEQKQQQEQEQKQQQQQQQESQMDQQQQESQMDQQQQQESTPVLTQDTQMLVDEESTSQSSQT